MRSEVERDLVVLLHGMGRTSFSMASAAYRLRRAGFDTANIGYPSRRRSIDELAGIVAAKLPPSSGRTMHFLTHSLGGIVLRRLVQLHRPKNLGRAVMLGPPNGGSRLAARMRDLLIFRMTMGPAGQQLCAGPDCVPSRLGPVDFELGVVAGNRTLDPFAYLIDGESDGKVTLEETRVEGMTDWLVVPRGHPFLMTDGNVITQAVHFFRHGRFQREGASVSEMHRRR